MTTKSNSLYLNTSRYVHGGETETANNRIEWWDRHNFQLDSTDVRYAIEKTYEGNPQAIATVFYGDPRYWWFICQYNSILDPIDEIQEGRIIFIPTKDRMQLMLTGREGGFDSQRELIPSIPPLII